MAFDPVLQIGSDDSDVFLNKFGFLAFSSKLAKFSSEALFIAVLFLFLLLLLLLVEDAEVDLEVFVVVVVAST